MYLSTTGIQPQIPNPELWNAGVLPMNMGGPGNWLNHPAVQASLLARQQSVPGERFLFHPSDDKLNETPQ